MSKKISQPKKEVVQTNEEIANINASELQKCFTTLLNTNLADFFSNPKSNRVKEFLSKIL